MFLGDITGLLAERSLKPEHCDDDNGPYKFDEDYRSQVLNK